MSHEASPARKVPSVAEVRKALVGLSSALAVVVMQFAPDSTADRWITVAIATIGAVLTYVIPNQQAAP